MNEPTSILRGGLKLGTGALVTQACSFVRNVMIARVISPQNYGIAATFAMTFFLFEMISNLSYDKLLIQAPDGNEPAFENTAHLLQAGRGLINAAFIFLLGGPISHLFGVPQARWAFEYLALVPLIKGFSHLDLNRVQRDMKFGPSITVDVSSNVLVTLVTLPLTLWLRDYSAMLWILVALTLAATIGSHLVAERRYGWAWHPLYTKRILDFGWPLLINGLLMYGIFQGDRFVIGSAKRIFSGSPYTLTDLGLYSIAFALTMAPTMLVANVSMSLFLPLLSRAKDSRVKFTRTYQVCVQSLSLLAASITIPFIVMGGWLVVVIYGLKYAGASSVIGWLAAMWAIRIIRVAPTLAAMAGGDTKTSMMSNVVRTSALLGVLVVAATGLDMSWIAVCGFLGELMALAMLVWRLKRHHSVPAAICLKPFSIFALGVSAAAIAVTLGVGKLGALASLLVSLELVTLTVLVMLLTSPVLRHDIDGFVFRMKSSIAEKTKFQVRPQQL